MGCAGSHDKEEPRHKQTTASSARDAPPIRGLPANQRGAAYRTQPDATSSSVVHASSASASTLMPRAAAAAAEDGFDGDLMLPVFSDLLDEPLGGEAVGTATVTRSAVTRGQNTESSSIPRTGSSRLFRGNAVHLLTSNPDSVGRTREWVLETRGPAPSASVMRRHVRRAAQRQVPDGSASAMAAAEASRCDDPPLVQMFLR